jgi:uncharacterized protein YyaL (SSP411 family)
MEEESFADATVAAVLNNHFVPIKVDREERPDVDSVYMKTCQLVRGSGGWPLSVFLTPAGRPFYVGTYFPPEPQQGMPGFEQLCRDVAASWNNAEEREEIEERADQWTAAMRDDLEGTPEAPTSGDRVDAGLLEDAADTALRIADREFGGFGRSGPKFPQTGRIHMLLRANQRTGRDAYSAVVSEMLDGMANGGLYDQLGGGFHRYATDRSWTVPHFEKMLYDQAGLARAYLAGWQALGTERYATVARETLQFVEQDLMHPDGGFFSTLDAQSEDPATGHRKEGAFWVWTPDDVEAVFEDTTDQALFKDRYGISEAGNFEDKQTVLTLATPTEQLANAHDRSQRDIEDRLSRLRDEALTARSQRPHPPRDEKILAGWNGLMISAFAEGALALDPSFAEVAVDALTFCQNRLWDPQTRRLTRRWIDGEQKISGYLEDYASLGRGALDTYQATGEVDHLVFAIDLARVIIEEFWDETDQTLYFTPQTGESLVARPQEPDDSSTPSSMGIAASLLFDLAHFVPDDRFQTVASAVIETHTTSLASDPLSHTSLVIAADTRETGGLELTVAADRLPESWRQQFAGEYIPGRLLSVRPPTKEALGPWLNRLELDTAPPIWANREAHENKPTLYACRSFTCSPPVHDPETALSWAEQQSF